MSALFNFEALIFVLLLAICTAAYIHQISPEILNSNKDGSLNIIWKLARIGERLSPYISLGCVIMAVRFMFY